MPAGILHGFELGTQLMSRRSGGTVLNTTELAAIPARSRDHGMVISVQAAGSGAPAFAVFDETSSEGASGTVIVPAAGSGRWKILSSVTTSTGLAFDPGFVQATPVVLDHADVSPKELLAANANVDRIVFVKAVATEAAAGGPDIDIGSDTTDPDSVVNDFKAGAWIVGDTLYAMVLLPAGEALVATIAAAGTAGALDVYLQAIVVPKDRAVLVAGQDETGDTTITVTGIAAGDELVSLFVFDPAGPSFAARALADFTVGAGVLNVVGNAADNTGHQYHIIWRDKT